MAKTRAQRAKKRQRERARLGRRRAEQLEARRNERVTVWFPKPEDLNRPATIDDEVLELQRELLKEIE